MESLLSDLRIPPFLNNVAIVLFTEENHIAKVGKVLQHEFARIAVSLDECYNNKKIAWTPEHIQTF
jgi:hypothetical protein